MEDLIVTDGMMPFPFLADEAEWNRFYEETRSWIGTPFRHCAAVKGRGVDCSLLVGSIFKELGIITYLNYSYYHADWFMSGSNDLILAYMKKHIQNYLNTDLQVVQVAQPLYRGDIVTLQIAHNQLNNHAVIYVGGGSIVHAMSFGKVEQITFPKTWVSRIGNVFRLCKR